MVSKCVRPSWHILLLIWGVWLTPSCGLSVNEEKAPVCLCATDNVGSFRTLLTTQSELDKLNDATYKAFRKADPLTRNGRVHVESGVMFKASYILAWGYPLGFTNQPDQFSDCLRINQDGTYRTMYFKNYSMAQSGNAGKWICDTENSQSQSSDTEAYVYACECNPQMQPVECNDGACQCYRVNANGGCGTSCYTNEWDLRWNVLLHSDTCTPVPHALYQDTLQHLDATNYI